MGYTLFQGYAHLASGLTCGLSGLAAGMAIGIVGDAGVRANAQQPKLFTGMLLIFIFAEALALYGLIVGIILSSAGAAGAAISCASVSCSSSSTSSEPSSSASSVLRFLFFRTCFQKRIVSDFNKNMHNFNTLMFDLCKTQYKTIEKAAFPNTIRS